MSKTIIYAAILLMLVSASIACKKPSCDREHPELCKDFIEVYDTTITRNIYDCKKLETRISHDFTVYETDKTAVGFGKPLITVSYDEAYLKAAYGCALRIEDTDCLGAKDLKIKNLINRSIQVDLIYATKNLAFEIPPFQTVTGGDSKDGYCSGQARVYVTLIKKL